MAKSLELTITPTASACCSELDAAISDGQATDLARAFAALADPVRLQLFGLIAAAGGACSCDLIEPLGKSQPTISHHTRVLAEAGLIVGEKNGRWMNWSVVPARLAQLSQLLAP
jgi:ArsR family transcriptional regulator, arsenate/arsenite/antimonite-responsive transcriptional repressor